MTYEIRQEPPKEAPVTLVLTLTPTEARELATYGKTWGWPHEIGLPLSKTLYDALLAAAAA